MTIEQKIEKYENMKNEAVRIKNAYEYLSKVIERCESELKSVTRYYETVGFETEQYRDRSGDLRWISKDIDKKHSCYWETVKDSEILDYSNYDPYYEPIKEERFYTDEEMKDSYNYEEYIAISNVIEWLKNL